MGTVSPPLPERRKGRVLTMMSCFILSVLAFPSLAQDTLKCANAGVLQPRTERICNELLPLDAKVWYAQKQGPSCFCECERLKQLPLEQVNVLRKKRGDLYKERILDFNAKIQGQKIHSGAAGPGHGGSASCDPCDGDLISGICLIGDRVCPEDDLVPAVLREIGSSDLTYGGVVELLTFFLVSDGSACEDRFPWISSGETCPPISLPTAFVRHPAIEEELLAFMILHEIGHAVTRTDDGALNCEHYVDAWAAEIGMRALYGSEYAVAIDEVISQFNAYFGAIYADDVRELPHGSSPGSCLNVYPALRCRTGVIRMEATASGLLTMDDVDTYMEEEDCWDGAISYAPSRGTPSCGDHCGKEDGDDTVGGKVDWPGIDTTLAVIGTRMTLLDESLELLHERFKDLYCLRYPDRCLKFGKLVKDGIRPPSLLELKELRSDLRSTLSNLDSAAVELQRAIEKLEP